MCTYLFIFYWNIDVLKNKSIILIELLSEISTNIMISCDRMPKATGGLPRGTLSEHEGAVAKA